MAPQEIRKQLEHRPVRIWVQQTTSYDVDESTHAYVDMLTLQIGIKPDESGFPSESVYISPNHVSKIERLPVPRTSKPADSR